MFFREVARGEHGWASQSRPLVFFPRNWRLPRRLTNNQRTTTKHCVKSPLDHLKVKMVTIHEYWWPRHENIMQPKQHQFV